MCGDRTSRQHPGPSTRVVGWSGGRVGVVHSLSPWSGSFVSDCSYQEYVCTPSLVTEGERERRYRRGGKGEREREREERE